MEITKDTILRAWRDEEYAKGLDAETRKAIPARPTADDGSELSDAQLEEAAGGTTPGTVTIGLIVGGSGVAGAGAGYGAMELID